MVARSYACQVSLRESEGWNMVMQERLSGTGAIVSRLDWKWIGTYIFLSSTDRLFDRIYSV